MNTQYHLLIGTNRETNTIESLFGDYDRNVVKCQRIDELDSGAEEYWRDLRVVKLDQDGQAFIDGWLAGINCA